MRRSSPGRTTPPRPTTTSRCARCRAPRAASGYFGYTYFEENTDTLKDFAIDGVKPTAETITDGTYPLSRPLFIYVKHDRAGDRPEVKAFVQYYLENAITLAEEQQFVPAPQADLDAAIAKLGRRLAA